MEGNKMAQYRIPAGGLEYTFVYQALLAAFEKHEELGDRGLEEVQKNQFEETALRADIECEKAVIDYLRNDEVPIRVVSEEHGIIDVTANPMCVGVLDGIDGTYVYRNQRRTGRHATIFAMMCVINPRYKDYFMSGVVEHATRRMFLVSADRKTVVITLGESLVELDQLGEASSKELNAETRIDVHDYTPREQEMRKKFVARFPRIREDTKCASLMYTDLLLGGIDVVIESRKKRDLEKCAFYGLIIGAGGVVITEDGEDLGNTRYLACGYEKDDGPMIIAAANRELAEQVRQFMMS